jgi:uncharacterized membrane protein YcaP (DUF421 family)
MEQSGTTQIFDWHRMFVSEDLPLSYLPEIAFRTFVMFIILIIGLKFLSKRGVKQLSVFELAILIALGSAIGDPMFYSHVPVTYGIVVLIIVILLYKVITRLTARYKKMELILEGKPVMLLKDGRIQYKTYVKVGLPYDKFFAELRLQSVDHLGQVRKAYLETSGEISIYLYKDDQVVPGLPIYPESISKPLDVIKKPGDFACIYCGNIQHIDSTETACVVCRSKSWIEPETCARIN